jgi:hypothetical protein
MLWIDADAMDLNPLRAMGDLVGRLAHAAGSAGDALFVPCDDTSAVRRSPPKPSLWRPDRRPRGSRRSPTSRRRASCPRGVVRDRLHPAGVEDLLERVPHLKPSSE